MLHQTLRLFPFPVKLVENYKIKIQQRELKINKHGIPETFFLTIIAFVSVFQTGKKNRRACFVIRIQN